VFFFFFYEQRFDHSNITHGSPSVVVYRITTSMDMLHRTSKAVTFIYPYPIELGSPFISNYILTIKAHAP